jgi:excisionase family DNA binding protein
MRDQHANRTADRARAIAAEVTQALTARRQADEAIQQLVAELVTLAAAVSTTTVAPRLLTTEQAAAALGVSPETVKRLIKNGDLQSRLIGSARRIPVEAVEAYVMTLPADLPNRPRAS